MYQFIFFTDLVDTIYVAKTIGAYKCAHALRSAGYSVLVIDHLHTFDEIELKDLLNKVVSDQTLAVGFSATFFRNTNVPVNPDGSITYTNLPGNTFFPQGKQVEDSIVSHIKQLNPNCKITLGGTTVTQHYQNKNIDYAFIGFSEASIVNLANHLYKKTDLTHSMKNIWGTVIIDDRKAESYDFQNSEFRWLKEDVVNARSLPIEIARGCIFKCKFCAFSMNGKQNLDFIKNVELLRTELQDTYDQFGVTTYSIIDDTFNDNDYKLNVILEAIKKLTFQPKFWAYTRLDLMATKKHIDILYDIGVRAFYFGIETLNKQTGKIIGKGHSPQSQINTIQELRAKFGNTITMHGSFIIGLPEESIESVTNTFNLIMNGTIPLHSFDFKTLFIDNANLVNWSSDISKNYTSYGYTAVGDTNNLSIAWKNDYMTQIEAKELENTFRQQSQNSDNFYMPGQPAWALANYGYDLPTLMNTLHRDAPWHEFNLHKKAFIQEYKEQLYKLI